MGLLDEAIREHLELKRRRGADPAEIARQEREALGPSRRPSEAVAEADEAAEVADEPVAAAAAPAAEWEETDEPTVAEPAFDDVDEDGDEDWDEADVDELEEVDDNEPRTQVMEPAPRDIAVPPPPPAPPAQTGDPGQPTSEYDVLAEDDQPRAEPPGAFRARDDAVADESEDVLEETPEFLQETPEHDRLWFEQRPPRDFDFDG
jgi:hypothetical protein